MIDDAKLAEWREACEKATPGPWCSCCGGIGAGSEDPQDPAVIRIGSVRTTLLTMKQEDDNARLIALSRAALPALLDEVERLRKELERVRGMLARMEEWYVYRKETANEVFEHIGEEFYAATGMLRPGKSQSPECYNEDEERSTRFKDWCLARQMTLAADVRAYLAETEVRDV